MSELTAFGPGVSDNLGADRIKIVQENMSRQWKKRFESKESGQKNRTRKGSDHQRQGLAGFRSRDFRVSCVMLVMRLVILFPYLFPSFLPYLLSSLRGSWVRSFEGVGRNFTLERNDDGVETFSRERKGVFDERWPCSLTCCGLLDS